MTGMEREGVVAQVVVQWKGRHRVGGWVALEQGWTLQVLLEETLALGSRSNDESRWAMGRGNWGGAVGC